MVAYKATVSVIIPTYNREEYIAEAIDSVLAQDFDVLEIIIIDDGSTDNTHNIIQNYKCDICYIKTENHGVSAARNTGILRARGDYIAFLDSDDVWPNQSLRKRMEKILQSDADLVFGDVEEFNSERKLSTTFKRDCFDHNKIFKSLLVSNRIPTPTVICRRSILIDVGMFDDSYVIAEDWDLWLRISHASQIVFVDYICAKIRKHASNATISREKSYRYVIRLKCHVLKQFDLSEKERKLAVGSLFDNCGDFAYFLFCQYRYKEARKYYWIQLQYPSLVGWRTLMLFISTLMPTACLRIFRKLKKVR